RNHATPVCRREEGGERPGGQGGGRRLTGKEEGARQREGHRSRRVALWHSVLGGGDHLVLLALRAFRGERALRSELPEIRGELIGRAHETRPPRDSGAARSPRKSEHRAEAGR